MSLVGSLEDLGLGDILQIVSLSRKSGMLTLRSDAGEGRIVLREGLVQAASIEGGAQDLCALLVDGDVVDAEAFGRARALAERESLDLDTALERECDLSAEHVDGLRRAHVERSVMQMFGWRNGEFSFEIREKLGPEESELVLSSGLSTQYLTMEATRRGDEASASDADELEPVFSGEDGEEDSTDALALVSAQRVEAGEAAEAESDSAAAAAAAAEAEARIGAESGADSAPPSEVAVEVPEEVETEVPVAVLPPRPTGTTRASETLVAIDANLSSLEWLKSAVGSLFERVHIFQHHELAVDRIRQYMLRGTVPVVVMSDEMLREREARSVVERLRGLSATMRVLALRSQSNDDDSIPPGADALLRRPASPSADPARRAQHRALAERLCEELEPWLRGEPRPRPTPRGALGDLKSVSDRLRDPSTQGEVLSLVLEFASERFGRVAIFMLRDDGVVGMAQRGLPPTGGPDDEGMRGIVLEADEIPECFQESIESRGAHLGRPTGDRDRNLVRRLGAAVPDEVYVAPIESGGAVAALVYADNLPEEKAIGDTTALEIVLHEAGLALDRAVLERALADSGD